MIYAKDTKKDTVYTTVNQLVQPKKYSGLSVMPPYPAPLQAKRGGANEEPVPKETNHTGMPDNLKTGVENRSGFSMDDIRVHYNSSKPAQLQALAYTQGTDIHVAPGQEKHLPHEAWHVVQQKQGRVQPTFQMKGPGVGVNDDAELEQEADEMGSKADGPANDPALNNNLKQVYKALPPNLKMLISLAELESGFGLGFLESVKQKISLQNFERIFKELSQPENLIQFYLGSKVGMSLGALKDLGDNVAGLWEIVKVGFKYSPAMQLYEWTFDTKNKIKKTQEEIKKVTEIVEGIYQFARELDNNPEFFQQFGKELGALAGQESAKWFNGKFVKMSSFDKGKTVGEITGYITMEIVLAVIAPEELAAKGGAWAGKISKSSKLVGKIVELLARIPGLKKILIARGYLKGEAAVVETERIAVRIKGFTEVESRVINEARTIINSSEFAKIEVAQKTGQSITVNIGSRTIQYEPGLPASGMTMFGENGFLIGREAFTSKEELAKTVLHELYRLNTSASSAGVSAELATQETQAAFDFAGKAYKELIK